MPRAIGGFLPIRLDSGRSPAQPVITHWTKDSAGYWLLHNARSALHALWVATQPKRIWLPAYVCAEIVAAVPPSGKICFYSLDETLSPRIGELSKQVQSGDHVLVINYFGRPPSPDLAAFAKSLSTVGWIEDRAHSVDATENPWADWLLYSPRKLFGVPDGGILVAPRKTLGGIVTTATKDLSFVVPLLERFEDVNETENDRWYANYVRQEEAMRVGPQAMSRLSFELLSTCDAEADAAIRRRNYQVLHQRLDKWAFFRDPEIRFAPLGFPIRVREADKLCKRLAKMRIFAARHWKNLPSDPSIFRTEHQLARELVTLPCDYRYGDTEMGYVADAVVAAMASES